MHPLLPVFCLAFLGAELQPEISPTEDIPTVPAPDDRLEVESVPTSCDSEVSTPGYERVELPEPTSDVHRFTGSGLALGDFDGDGQTDVFSVGRLSSTLWRQVSPGTWEASILEGEHLLGAVGASAADYDADGDLDVVITRDGLPNTMLENQGWRFVDASHRVGLEDLPFRSVSATWGDLDGDEDLDLLIANYGPRPPDAFAPDMPAGDPSELYLNNGDGTFTPAHERLPPEVQDAYTFNFVITDLDDDERPEVLSVHDFGWVRPSQLLWTTDDGLVPDNGRAGFHPNFAGMGVALGDVNADGTPDVVQSSWRDVSLLESMSDPHGGPLWVEAADRRDLRVAPLRQVFGWGTALADLDNDTDLDAVIVYGDWDDYPNELEQPDGLWRQDEDGSFADVAGPLGVDDAGPGRGLVVADLDGNGWLDLVKRQVGGPTRILAATCGTARALQVRLHDTTSHNLDAVGARVTVSVGEHRWTRWVRAGGTSLFSSGPLDVHFGLGEHAQVDTVEIRWPDGGIDVLHEVDGDQRLDVTRRAR